MTSVNLLIVLIVGALVGTFTGLVLGGVVDNLYLAMIAGILATIVAGIVRNTIMTRVTPELELEGMPLERLPQAQLLSIYSAIPLRMIAYSALASLAGSASAVLVATQSGVTSSALIGTLAGLFSGILMAILLLAYDIPRPKLSLRLPEAEREALRSVFTGLDDVQIARLLVAGRFNDIAKGTMLAEENKPLETLFFICTGHVKVTIAGREVAHLEKGNFVGEIAFLTEKPATATVVAEDSVRALVFERAELNQFFHNEAEVAGLVYQLLGRELAQKIKVSNIRISETAFTA
ncbi:MAG: cyclic nucleotide-binding domain-containing protein [Methyloceanibacter sp.]